MVSSFLTSHHGCSRLLVPPLTTFDCLWSRYPGANSACQGENGAAKAFRCWCDLKNLFFLRVFKLAHGFGQILLFEAFLLNPLYGNFLSAATNCHKPWSIEQCKCFRFYGLKAQHGSSQTEIKVFTELHSFSMF